MPDPVIERTTYTWDPVTAAWVHERGTEATPPPTPPDVHALQSYFFDPESKQWIRTVLAPMGRELAARYQGAHREPESTLGNKPKAAAPAPAKSGPGGVGVFVVVVVLLVMLGGFGVVASQLGLLGSSAPALASDKPAASG
ncbi:MAG TPA: hypothetical protein VJQ09_03460, partial [Candidatus Limnocylindria bacterium]|nr:hypothetical protein [Candidatus Limnocylindria bacterium]